MSTVPSKANSYTEWLPPRSSLVIYTASTACGSCSPEVKGASCKTSGSEFLRRDGVYNRLVQRSTGNHNRLLQGRAGNPESLYNEDQVATKGFCKAERVAATGLLQVNQAAYRYTLPGTGGEILKSRLGTGLGQGFLQAFLQQRLKEMYHS